MAAEGFVLGWFASIGLVRQWGRDRMAAEGRNTGTVTGLLRCGRQWGRDRMAAEGGHAGFSRNGRL